MWASCQSLGPPVGLRRALSHLEKHLNIWPGSDSRRVNPPEAITQKFDFLLCDYFLFIFEMYTKGHGCWSQVTCFCPELCSGGSDWQTEPINCFDSVAPPPSPRLPFCQERNTKTSPGCGSVFLGLCPSVRAIEDLKSGAALSLIGECASTWQPMKRLKSEGREQARHHSPLVFSEWRSFPCAVGVNVRSCDGVKRRGVTACSSGDWVYRFII